MSGSLNKVLLIGRLGRDPEIKYTPNGAPVAKFSIATEENFKDKSGEKQKRVEWHQVVAWNKLAEICGEYLTKGSQVYIEGKIQSHEWEKDGEKKRSFEIVASRLVMLGSNGKGENKASRNVAADRPVTAEDPISDEDIPF
jgi:single-strand DNA-binding protein